MDTECKEFEFFMDESGKQCQCESCKDFRAFNADLAQTERENNERTHSIPTERT